MATVKPIKEDDIREINDRISELKDQAHRMRSGARYQRWIEEAERVEKLVSWLEELVTLRKVIGRSEKANIDILTVSHVVTEEMYNHMSSIGSEEEVDSFLKRKMANDMIDALAEEIVFRKEEEKSLGLIRISGALMVVRRNKQC